MEGMMQIETELRKETHQLSMALRSPPARGAWDSAFASCRGVGRLAQSM